MTNLFDLSNKVAIVTGGNSGIGLGMGRGLASAGAKVVIAARNETKSAAAVRELRGLGAEALAIPCDITDGNSVETLVRDTIARFRRIDILVNNAGTNIRKRPEHLTLEEWQLVMETNLGSAFRCCQACYPTMKAAGGGKILNSGSMLSIFGSPTTPAYAASKGGMVQLTKSLATAWAEDNIQVNCFLPGWIDTPLTRQARADIEGLHEKVIERTPAKRWGHPDDLQGLAVFLASAASDFITGAAIPVDGGFSANAM
jgi:2-deoxy-D-gluconate 3-dehydrogenase